MTYDLPSSDSSALTVAFADGLACAHSEAAFEEASSLCVCAGVPEFDDSAMDELPSAGVVDGVAALFSLVVASDAAPAAVEATAPCDDASLCAVSSLYVAEVCSITAEASAPDSVASAITGVAPRAAERMIAVAAPLKKVEGLIHKSNLYTFERCNLQTNT